MGDKQKKKEEKKDKYEELEEKYKRALADFQNLLKQTAKEKEELVKYANARILEELLPVYDNLKLAVKHLKNGENNNSTEEGVKFVVKQFQEFLNSFGVKEIKTAGEKFDPERMEAVENRETDKESEDGLVAEELKAGYLLNGRTVVPARVAVFSLQSRNS